VNADVGGDVHVFLPMMKGDSSRIKKKFKAKLESYITCTLNLYLYWYLYLYCLSFYDNETIMIARCKINVFQCKGRRSGAVLAKSV
jgi:hypothetical protein